MDERLRYLFQRFTENSCTFQEMEEFFDLASKPENEEILRRLIRDFHYELKDNISGPTYVDEMGRLYLTEPGWIPPNSGSNYKKRSKPLLRNGLLAIALLITVIAGLLYLSKKQSNTESAFTSLTRKSTDRSELKYLLLKDSTQVWLNAASTLEFPDQFDPAKREVYLSGEAFFDVKHADKVPFIIHTREISTTVLGTSFNIKAYPGQKNITVSVSRGRVKVSGKEGWSKTLTEGQQVKVIEENEAIVPKKIGITQVGGWQRGDMNYDDETLQDIISDLERIYNVKIEISNPSLKDQIISASFKKEIGIQNALAVLCKVTETNLRSQNGKFIIE